MVVSLNQGLNPDIPTNILDIVDVNEEQFFVGCNHHTYLSMNMLSEVRSYDIKIQTEATDHILKLSAEASKCTMQVGPKHHSSTTS